MRRPPKHFRLARNVEALYRLRCDGFKSAKMFDGPPRPSKNLRGLCWAPETFVRITRMQRPAKHFRLARNVKALHRLHCDGFKSAKMFDGPPRPSKNLRGPCWAPEAFAGSMGPLLDF
ncbi:hypothetical protein Adt_18953 [Abeliophyllum distichum]|uniref:Uncharacterized protein n=1 Tax=Abeliophyllum distichum TaxID=126358 RepID=A0ABD1TL68_9LAMI